MFDTNKVDAYRFFWVHRTFVRSIQSIGYAIANVVDLLLPFPFPFVKIVFFVVKNKTHNYCLHWKPINSLISLNSIWNRFQHNKNSTNFVCFSCQRSENGVFEFRLRFRITFMCVSFYFVFMSAKYNLNRSRMGMKTKEQKKQLFGKIECQLVDKFCIWSFFLCI